MNDYKKMGGRVTTGSDSGFWPVLSARIVATDKDSGKVVMVMGSEGRGLRTRVAGACDQLGLAAPVRVERYGAAEHLVIVVHAARQIAANTPIALICAITSSGMYALLRCQPCASGSTCSTAKRRSRCSR